MTVASTGASEKGLRRAGVTDFEKVYLHPGPSRRLLSRRAADPPQAAVLRPAMGASSARKRWASKASRSASTSIATAIQFNGTVHDLAEAELCYAPQFGAAKDPVNLAGMLAENVLNGDMPVADWMDRWTAPTPCCVDVREPAEFAAGHIPQRDQPAARRDARPLSPSCRRIATSGCAAASGSAPTTPRASSRSTAIAPGICPGGYATYTALKAAGVTR